MSPVDDDVQGVVRDMARGTWAEMERIAGVPGPYEPSERYAGKQHLSVDVADPSVDLFRELQQTPACDPGGDVLHDPRTVFCYFGRLVDHDNRRLIGMRRSSSFKGVLKQKPWLISLIQDELRLVEDDLSGWITISMY